METIHKPVLLKEVIDSLELKKGLVVFDGNLGGGGYSEKICEEIGEEGTLIGVDLDSDAVKRSSERLLDKKCRKNFYKENFANIDKVLSRIGIDKVDRIVLDLGFSSDQLEFSNRGFSFLKEDEELDLRYDFNEGKVTAKEIVNNWQQDDLERIFLEYGEERRSKEIAKAIVLKRKSQKIDKVGELVEIVREVKKHKGRINPATKIFRALRIAVNDELENLKIILNKTPNVIKEDGIIAVATFHSLEDRIVKNIFKEWERNGIGVRVNKKVIKPSYEEIKNNRRARSAKLRVFKFNY